MLRCSMLAVFAYFLATSFVNAQAPAPSAPEPEHAILKQFVGEWTTEAEVVTGPGEPAGKSTGQVTARMLGALWVVSEVSNDMMGTKMEAVQTIGYDPKTKKYVGTWVDSMLNHL